MADALPPFSSGYVRTNPLRLLVNTLNKPRSSVSLAIPTLQPGDQAVTIERERSILLKERLRQRVSHIEVSLW